MITERFHSLLSLYPKSPLRISTLNIVANITRSGQDKLPVLLKCGINCKLGKVFGLTLSDINPHSSNFCNITYHYLYTILTELGAEDLAPRVMTTDSISELSQYYIGIKNDKDYCGIEDLENISNPFKIVNIMDLPKII